jgi:nucleotide-binding universal stress UspA family protein
MKQFFGKILLAVDGSHSCLRAREIAASLAREFNSEVTVVHVISHDFMHPELKAHHQLPSLILHELDKSYQKAEEKSSEPLRNSSKKRMPKSRLSSLKLKTQRKKYFKWSRNRNTIYW